MRRALRHGLISLACLAAMTATAARAGGPAVRLGILATTGETAAADYYASSVELLKRAWKSPVEVSYHDLPGLEAAIEARQLDFFISNPGFYATVQGRLSCRHLATLSIPRSGDPNASMAGAFIVRAGRADIAGFGDMRGKTAAAVDRDAFGGYLVQMGEIRERGMDPEGFFSRTLFLGYPMQKVFEAVASGEADVGLVRACLLEQMAAAGRVERGAFRVIGEKPPGPLRCKRSTGLYPDWVFASTPSATAEESRRAAAALLSAPPDPRNGCSWSVASDFSAVEDLYRGLRAGHYAYLRDWSLAGFVERHLPWIVTASVLLTALLMHSAVLASLVRRRTGHLRRAMAEAERAHEEAARAEGRLRAMERASITGILSTMVAHELKQPLGAIMNYADGIRTLAKMPEVDRAMLDMAAGEIQAETGRAGQIIDRVRLYAKPSGLRREPCRLDAIALAAAAAFGRLPGEKAPLKVLRAEPCPVTGDALGLELVVVNLLKNASEAALAGPGDPAVTLEAAREGGSCRVTVVNTGAEVDPALFANLFEPKASAKEQGLGFGVAIAARIMESHAGGLRLEARPGGGAVAVASMEAAGPPEAAPEATPAATRKGDPP
ncbi:MAG: PhnD/SsuA/transferrin family substrate-binding protein [Duodenibacillus sp.]|nr:PhnD/SsuA/transferrin family substrate-binding protein [Duodenibacillus sp.]